MMGYAACTALFCALLVYIATVIDRLIYGTRTDRYVTCLCCALIEQPD